MINSEMVQEATPQPTRKPPSRIAGRIDPEILPLVEALRADSDLVTTMCSCSGHDREPAYITLAVEPKAGYAHFFGRLSALDREFEDRIDFDVELMWEDAIEYDWIVVHWTIHGHNRARAPSQSVLAALAASYRVRPGPPKDAHNAVEILAANGGANS
ncbi:hypothetical protein LZC95_07935 [Pendulispora brunnea]|uniref:Uncharacterized protein n=1 Tax=Pendulispora brunnea TaxID=2905690 RepID=A0ABZ2KDU3_9BACT